MENKNSFSEHIQGATPVLVDFYAEWCGPCKIMAPVLKEIKSRLHDQLTILKIDIDKNPQAASAYQVQGVPTLILFRQGKMLWRQSGALNTAQLEQVLRKKLSTD